MKPKHILVTLPRTVKWTDYERELAAVADGSQTMWFRVPSIPKITQHESRCYIMHEGVVKGWMLITGLMISSGFTCSTTEKYWPKGNYVGRSGEFHHTGPAEVLLFGLGKLRGFQGYRYYEPPQPH